MKSPPTPHLLAATLVGVLLGGSHALAFPVLIDFGVNSQTTGTDSSSRQWNNVSAPRLGGPAIGLTGLDAPGNLISADGTDSGLTFAAARTPASTNVQVGGAAVDFTGALGANPTGVDYDFSAYGDSIFINDDTNSTNTSNEIYTITIDGLDDELAFDFTFLSAFNGGGSNGNVHARLLTGSTTEDTRVDADFANDATNVQSWFQLIGVTPDTGQVQIEVYGDRNNNGRINTMEIGVSGTPPPEPEPEAGEADFSLSIASNDPTSRFQITWPGVPGKSYTLRSSEDLSTPPSTWPVVAENLLAPTGGGTLAVNIDPTDQRRFYVAEDRLMPNIVFILVDDWGWNDVSYNAGPNALYLTPRMDQLSQEWMRFDNFLTPSPMCSPTRVSILTGKNPARHGVTQWLSGSDIAYTRNGEAPTVYCPGPQSSGIEDSETTLGETFQDSGYDTAFFGKWHMGKLNATGGPANHGYASQIAVIEENSCQMFYPFSNNPHYFPGSGPGDYFTDLLTDEAIDFVTAERDQPFYLHMTHFAMHHRIDSKDNLRSMFQTRKNNLGIGNSGTKLDDYSHTNTKLSSDSTEYAGELYNLDENIGRLVDALKDAGLYDDTIIVLTGDNGGRSSTNLNNATSVTPLRGGKTFVFDGGLRTPTLVHWPGQTGSGDSTNVPVSSMDFYPTLLEMTGLPQNPQQHMDGVSLVPLFEGEDLERDTLYYHFPHYQREGSYPASAIREGNFKLIRNYHHGDLLLFDLSVDPNEETNLAPAMPGLAASLDQKLTDYLSDVGAFIPQPIQ